jgi:hypothetical protein
MIYALQTVRCWSMFPKSPRCGQKLQAAGIEFRNTPMGNRNTVWRRAVLVMSIGWCSSTKGISSRQFMHVSAPVRCHAVSSISLVTDQRNRAQEAAPTQQGTTQIRRASIWPGVIWEQGPPDRRTLLGCRTTSVTSRCEICRKLEQQFGFHFDCSCIQILRQDPFSRYGKQLHQQKNSHSLTLPITDEFWGGPQRQHVYLCSLSTSNLANERVILSFVAGFFYSNE